MDVCQSPQALRRLRAAETRKPPLVSAKKNNAVTHRTRYSSPSLASSSSSRRCSSPNLTRTTTIQSSQLLHKRAQSAERRRPSTPSPPRRPSTPVHESSVNVQTSTKKITVSRLQESLWPSTMRSLSVSFQSDTISIPVSKKEKPSVSNSDRTLRSTSNVAHKQVEAPTIRKPSPERKRSPLKGKNASDQSENSKPVNGSHSRLIDQRRWPSRIGGKVSSNAVHSSVEFADKAIRTLPSLVPCTGSSSPRTLSFPNETSKPFQKSSRDASRLLMLPENSKIVSNVKPVDDSSLLVAGPQKFVPASSSDKIGLLAPPVRSQSLPTPGLRPCSPSKTSALSSSNSRGLSPSRSRPLTPPSRGASPSRIRATNLSSQFNCSISVLSFIADFKRGKKDAANIEDAHQLRLVYNRYLQWRFANARAEAVLYIQNATVERTLYNVWNTKLSVWDSVIRKRINLHQLKLELKLNSILNGQMAYLNEWASLESDHFNALAGAIEDLKAGIFRLPVTGGAMADSEDLKVAICSAVHVMQAMGSTICSLLAKVEGVNDLVSELATLAAQEKAMLDECEELLASAAAKQAEENSLRTHLMQMKQVLETNEQLQFSTRLNLNCF